MTLRWSPEQYQQYLRRGQTDPLPVLTEAVWHAAVLRLLAAHRYVYLYHTFDSRRSPSGFPDICAVHETPGHKLLAIELKTDVGQVTPAQQAWLGALAGSTGVVAEVWRPAQLEEIVERLRGMAG